jgi:WD40 repeat protein
MLMCVWDWQGHTKVIQALGWNCDGRKLATASAASDVRIWSVDSHKEGKEQVLEDHKQSVDGLSWSPTNPDVRQPPFASLLLPHARRVRLTTNSACTFLSNNAEDGCRCWQLGQQTR